MYRALCCAVALLVCVGAVVAEPTHIVKQRQLDEAHAKLVERYNELEILIQDMVESEHPQQAALEAYMAEAKKLKNMIDNPELLKRRREEPMLLGDIEERKIERLSMRRQRTQLHNDIDLEVRRDVSAEVRAGKTLDAGDNRRLDLANRRRDSILRRYEETNDSRDRELLMSLLEEVDNEIATVGAKHEQRQFIKDTQHRGRRAQRSIQQKEDRRKARLERNQRAKQN